MATTSAKNKKKPFFAHLNKPRVCFVHLFVVSRYESKKKVVFVFFIFYVFIFISQILNLCLIILILDQ